MFRFFVGLLALNIFAGSSAFAVEPASSPLERTLTKLDADDYRGHRWQIEDFADQKFLVVAFLGTECPLAKLYAARLVDLQKTYAGRDIGFLAVMSNRQDSMAEIAAFARAHSIEFPVIKDAGNRIADRLAAERTPEVFLLDSDRKVCYWGRVDDQYGIGFAKDFPRTHDLKNAIEDRLAGRQVKLPMTRSVGCIIGRRKEPAPQADVTYSNQVARVLRTHCVECHREGEIAPFALTDYDEVSGWADMIAETVRDGRMPPWHANPEHGEFANDRRMSEQDKQLLYEWADTGAPQGDPAELPEPQDYVEGWLLPKAPDQVVDVSPEPFMVPAEGAVKYQYFTVDPGFTEDKWLRYAELKPGNREVVHHILAFARPKGSRRGLGAAKGYLVGYVPGTRIETLPDGWAKKIPAGSELVFQVHYTPIGSAQLDQSKLGMIFMDEQDVTHEIITTSAVQGQLKIPPHAESHEVTAVEKNLLPGQLIGFSPHMHLRGKAFRYELVDPDGKQEILLDIPNYDFNWQTFYLLKDPLPIRMGSEMLCTAVFDNSAKNLNNPDPSITVRWGDQTWDEMMIGYFHYAVPKVRGSSESMKNRLTRLARRDGRLKIFDRIDRDGDGRVMRDETPLDLRKAFDALDRNRDQILLRSEVESAD
ncbi:MAG: redoxin domain-containing protein [Pirellulaceae bacterium]